MPSLVVLWEDVYVCTMITYASLVVYDVLYACVYLNKPYTIMVYCVYVYILTNLILLLLTHHKKFCLTFYFSFHFNSCSFNFSLVIG